MARITPPEPLTYFHLTVGGEFSRRARPQMLISMKLQVNLGDSGGVPVGRTHAVSGPFAAQQNKAAVVFLATTLCFAKLL